ncbi:MAG: peptidoglycan DD-metalloendopeptidase family protein [Clostridia bacterium]|nr:peptidoglycan DD-metalloendopeptidase family protein [Clostridia bacterium]
MKKNKNRSGLKALLCFVLVLTCTFCTFSPLSVFAEEDKSLEELRDEYNKIEAIIQENQQNLNEVQGEIKDNKSKLDKLNSEIDDIQAQVDILSDRIDILNGDITSLNTNIQTITTEISSINTMITEIETRIAEGEILIADTREQLLERIRENYMAGGGSTLEILFTSEDLTSFLTRKELVAQVSEKDTKLITDLTSELVELNSLETQLEAEKVELVSKRTQLDSDMTTLTARQDDLESSLDVQEAKKKEATKKHEEVEEILEQLDEDSEEYKAIIKRQEEERKILEAQIDEYIKNHGSEVGDTPDEEYNNDGDMLWPVAGKTTMTAGYPAYKDGSAHWGIDICVVGATGGTRDENGRSYSLGKPFRAAQGGEVIIAANDDNWNYGFGNYCVIDHGDGTQTLYAHAQTLYVKKGDVVQKGENIGAIGETGNVTGPHLHFEVRVKRGDTVSRVQPLDYVSKP